MPARAIRVWRKSFLRVALFTSAGIGRRSEFLPVRIGMAISAKQFIQNVNGFFPLRQMAPFAFDRAVLALQLETALLVGFLGE